MKDPESVDSGLYELVVEQRDRLFDALSDVLEYIEDAISSGALGRKASGRSRSRIPGNDPEVECEKGLTRGDAVGSLGKLCAGCGGRCDGCHLSSDEIMLFEAIWRASDAARERRAEMPVVRPEDFERYEDGAMYCRSERWVAQQMYRFVVGYTSDSDRLDEKRAAEWSRAFNDVIAISLGKDGHAFHKLARRWSDGGVDGDESARDAAEWLSENADSKALVEECVKSRDGLANGACGVRDMLMAAVLLSLEFSFSRRYPGADMGVYLGAFSGISTQCLKIAGLYVDGRDAEKVGSRSEMSVERQRLFRFMEERIAS